jgi:hypothetical protein
MNPSWLWPTGKGIDPLNVKNVHGSEFISTVILLQMGNFFDSTQQDVAFVNQTTPEFGNGSVFAHVLSHLQLQFSKTRLFVLFVLLQISAGGQGIEVVGDGHLPMAKQAMLAKIPKLASKNSLMRTMVEDP